MASALAHALPASATEPWLSVDGDRRCGIEPGVLEARISAALAGDRDPERRVAIEVRSERVQTTVRIQLARGSVSLGQKSIVAASCGDAIDAAVAVAALALGSATRPGASPAPGDRDGRMPSERAERAGVRSSGAASIAGVAGLSLHAAPDAGASLRRPPDAVGASRELALDATAADELASSVGVASATTRPLHGLWSVGVDQGALDAPTLVVGLGLAGSLGQHELRAQLGYALPVAREREETGIGSSSSRTDFTALTIDGCRGLDAARWFSLCAGVEARMMRALEEEAGSNDGRSTRRRLEAGAFAVAGASFVYRAAAWQPRLDLAAPLHLIGGSAGADFLGIRASLGARLPF